MNYKSYMTLATTATMALCMMVMTYWLSLASDAYYVVKHKPARERIILYVQKPEKPSMKAQKQASQNTQATQTTRVAAAKADSKPKG
ncbi:MAG: hypothetical protein EP343_22155 [Deltaproteobacteria bacterium]|nr:MAG: hypothetical protein EP343_22155 [Deltaproteobacteria bacterium]